MRTLVIVKFMDGPLKGRRLRVPEDVIRSGTLSVLHPLAKDVKPHDAKQMTRYTRYVIRWTASQGWIGEAVRDGA